MKMLHEPAAGGGNWSAGQGTNPYQEIWQTIGRRKWRILAVLVLALALGACYCLLFGPWYDSTAQLLVLKKRHDTSPISGPDQARPQEEYLSTHMLLITSHRVIEQAIQKGDLQNLTQFRDQGGWGKNLVPWLTQAVAGGESEGRATERLTKKIMNALVVSRDAQKPGINPSSEILNLSFRGGVADECPKILNAVVASYQDFLGETFRNTTTETLELITQAQGVARKDLEAKEAAYQKFLAETPPLWKGQISGTTHQDRLFKIDAKLSAFRLRRAELSAAIDMLERAVKEGRNPTALVERLSALPANGDAGSANLLASKEPGLADRKGKVSLEEEYMSLQLHEAKLLTTLGPNHADVRAVRRQLAAVRQLLLPSSGSGGGADGKTGGYQELGKMKIELLKQERDDLELAEASLRTLFENEQKGVSSSYLHEIQDEAHRKGIERGRLLYESILHRLKEVSSVKDFGGYQTQVIGPPLRGALAVKKYFLTFGLSLFAGLMVGFGWAYLAEYADKKSRPSLRPEETERLNGVKPTAALPANRPVCMDSLH